MPPSSEPSQAPELRRVPRPVTRTGSRRSPMIDAYRNLRAARARGANVSVYAAVMLWELSNGMFWRATEAGGEWWAEVKQATLAERIGCSRDRVIKATAELEQGRIIRPIANFRKGPDGRAHRCANTYAMAPAERQESSGTTGEVSSKSRSRRQMKAPQVSSTTTGPAVVQNDSSYLLVSPPTDSYRDRDSGREDHDTTDAGNEESSAPAINTTIQAEQRSASTDRDRDGAPAAAPEPAVSAAPAPAADSAADPVTRFCASLPAAFAQQYAGGLRLGGKVRKAIEACAADGKLDDARLALSEWWAAHHDGGKNEQAKGCPNAVAALSGLWLVNIVEEARKRQRARDAASRPRPEFEGNADYLQFVAPEGSPEDAIVTQLRHELGRKPTLSEFFERSEQIRTTAEPTAHLGQRVPATAAAPEAGDRAERIL